MWLRKTTGFHESDNIIKGRGFGLWDERQENKSEEKEDCGDCGILPRVFVENRLVVLVIVGGDAGGETLGGIVVFAPFRLANNARALYESLVSVKDPLHAEAKEAPAAELDDGEAERRKVINYQPFGNKYAEILVKVVEPLNDKYDILTAL